MRDGRTGVLKQVQLILKDNVLRHFQGGSWVVENAGTQVSISVIDEGPGIPSEILDRVFDRFYRGEADVSVPGFGLGLPIAKALVEGMGGKISIGSGPGKGSKVEIVFSDIKRDKM